MHADSRQSDNKSAKSSPHSSRTRALGPYAAALILCLVATELRVLASCDSFWLDEIWSWSLAAQSESMWQILRYPLDNNHILNTWVIYLVGVDQPYFFFRVPAVVAGSAAVFFAGRTAARIGLLEGLIAMLVTGASFFLVQYSSEARGYAYVMLFAILAWDLAQLCRDKPSLGWDSLFVVVAIGGFLAHATFLFCYLGILAWSILTWIQLRDRRGDYSWSLARCHVATMFFLGTLIMLRGEIVVGGGDTPPLVGILITTISLALGGPEFGWTAIPIAALALGMFLGRIIQLYHNRSASWIFYATAVIVGPAMILATTQPAVLYPRYFLVPVLFLLMTLSELWSSMLRMQTPGKIAAALLLGAYLAGNGAHLHGLFTVGRGNYAAALDFMRQNTTAATLTVGSSHDFRNFTVLNFYDDGRHKPIAYCRQEDWPKEGSEWYLVENQTPTPAAPQRLEDQFGNQYRLAKWFPYAGLSGWHWLVYRKEVP